MSKTENGIDLWSAQGRILSIVRKRYQQGIAGVTEKADICIVVTETVIS